MSKITARHWTVSVGQVQQHTAMIAGTPPGQWKPWARHHGVPTQYAKPPSRGWLFPVAMLPEVEARLVSEGAAVNYLLPEAGAR